MRGVIVAERGSTYAEREHRSKALMFPPQEMWGIPKTAGGGGGTFVGVLIIMIKDYSMGLY